MNKEKIYQSLEFVRDEYLESAADAMTGKGKVKPRQLGKQLGVAAACVVLVGAIVSLPMLRPDTPNIAIPTYEDAFYSAADVASVFSTYRSDSLTNQYRKIYVSDDQYLYLNKLPEGEYVQIYQYNTDGQPPDQSSFQTSVADIAPRLFKSLGLPEFETPAKDIEVDYREYASTGSQFYETELSKGGYMIYARQFRLNEYYWINPSSANANKSISLDGEKIAVNQKDSDEEILHSLSSIKKKLFNVFGESFTDAKVIRSYGDDSEHGASWVTVYFYNADDHRLNETSRTPMSNYIRLEFDNFENSASDVVSDDLLTDVSIAYCRYRDDPETIWSATANAKLMSLEDAEKLLAAGYVFGGHSCPLCMAEQDDVDFSDYDYVSIEYIFEANEEKTQNNGFPFYAFYKYIGKSLNGNKIYAMTYVPAIEVKGLEEYFEGLKSEHS